MKKERKPRDAQKGLRKKRSIRRTKRAEARVVKRRLVKRKRPASFRTEETQDMDDASTLDDAFRVDDDSVAWDAELEKDTVDGLLPLSTAAVSSILMVAHLVCRPAKAVEATRRSRPRLVVAVGRRRWSDGRQWDGVCQIGLVECWHTEAFDVLLAA